MPRLIRIAARGVMEILRLLGPGPLNLRRNTSKSFFEASRIGNKTGNMLPLCCHFLSSTAVKRQQNWQHVATSESAIPNNYTN